MFRALKSRLKSKPTGADSASDRLDVVLVGDTSLGDWYLERQGERLRQRLRDDPMSFFAGVTPLVADSDLLIANLETVLYERPNSPLEGMKNYLGWDSPQRTAGVLQELGVDAVSLANNHAMDFGPDVLAATRSVLSEAGILSFGAGSTRAAAAAPATFGLQLGGSPINVHIIGGLKYTGKLKEFGFFATDDEPGINPLVASETIAQIRDVRGKDPHGLIILYPHWGDNYKWASDIMRSRSRDFLKAGADVILGHGAHMIQELAHHAAGTAVFSLGNFVFNSRGRYTRMGAPPFSCVARLSISRTPGRWDADLKLYPIVSDNTRTSYTPRPVDAQEARDLFALLAERPGADGDPFDESFTLASDNLGWYIGIASSLSPRFAKSTGTVPAVSPASPIVERTAQPVETASPTDTASRTAGVRRVRADPDRYGAASTQAFYARALEQRGIEVEKTEVSIRGAARPAIRFVASGNRYVISAARIYIADDSWEKLRRPDADAATIVRRKDIANSILRAHGFPAPEGNVFFRRALRDATLYFRALAPTYDDGFCVKPANGGLGKHVYVGIRDEEAFASAFRNVAEAYDRILVERALSGTVYRFLWVADRVPAVFMIDPMNVVGDGKSTVQELVEDKNNQRMLNPTLRPYPLRLGQTERRYIEKQGYEAASVLAAGTKLYLNDVSNRHAGADTVDVTDALHESYKTGVGAAISCIPGMLVCGADVIIRDPSQPADNANYGLLDLNTGPALAGHQLPWAGKARDVAGDIIDALLDK